MRDTGKILNECTEKLYINLQKFYENLGLSLQWDDKKGASEEKFIYAKGHEFIRNSILEVFEALYSGKRVFINDRQFNDMSEFRVWLFSKENIEKEAIRDKHQDFIDKAYSKIYKDGNY